MQSRYIHMGKSVGPSQKVKLNKDSFKSIVRFALPYWTRFLLAFFLIIVIAFSDVLQPYILKMAIDDQITPAIRGDFSVDLAVRGIFWLTIVYGILAVIHFLFGFAQEYLLQRVGGRIIMDLRNTMYDHIQRLPFSFFDRTPVGTIVTRVCNDTQAINEFYTGVLINFFKDFLTMIGIFVIMFSMNARLTFITIAVFPLIAFASITFRMKARRAFYQIRVKLAAINAFLAENITGIKIIQAFNAQQKKEEEFDTINTDYYKANLSRIKLFGLFRPLMDVVKAFSIALVIYFGARMVMDTTLEIGVLFAFTTYIGRFFQPIMNMTEMFNTTQSAVVASDRIATMLQAKPEDQPSLENYKTTDVQTCKGRIEFDHVWFAYVGEQWVLKDVSFTVEPGQNIAIVGMTGAGKTSIINLLCGFYENQKGFIRIDGVDIKTMTKQDLRKRVGMVLQDVFIFAGPLRSNIDLNDPSISFEQIRHAAKLTHAHSFIEKLPFKYDYELNESGSILSEGQRQLISFTRALVTDPPILVLDEATASIDSQTEQYIQHAMQNVMKGRTSISIAHRLSTIKSADRIIVLHRGRIKEMGTHDQLFALKGMYFDLYEMQFS